MLDDTLVVWGGEFGRTVYCQGTLTRHQLRPRSSSALLHHVAGRRRHQARHRPTAKPTTSATTSSSDPVHVHDLNATILHCLGIDHTRLTLQVPGPPFPPDRRARQRGQDRIGVISTMSQEQPGACGVWYTPPSTTAGCTKRSRMCGMYSRNRASWPNAM